MNSRWGIVIFLLMAACTSSVKAPEPVEGPSKELTTIDSLMWQRPDSALTLLLPWFDTCRNVSGNVSTMPDHDRHYANLLLAELLYKNDSTQTNRAELLKAVDYFDSLLLADACNASLRGFCRRDTPRVSANRRHPTAFLAARAHYINGVGYYENDSAVEACKEYMKALETTQDHFEEKELVEKKALFMALTYTRLTDLFSDFYLHEQAIYFAQRSLLSYRKTDSPIWYESRMLYEIGSNYDMMEQLDSADHYYRNALLVQGDTTSLVYKDIVALRSVLLYKKEGKKENTISRLYSLLLQSDSEMEYLSRCLTIGEVYYHEKQYDSACRYLGNVYDHTRSIASKKQSAEWLKNIYEIQGKESEQYEYARFLAPFANQEENTSATKSQLTELYNTFKQNILKQQHRLAMQKSKTGAITVLCAMLVVILVITLLFHRNKKKLKHLESVVPDESEILSKAWDKYAAFKEEPICQDIIGSVQGENIKRLATPKDYPNLVLNDEQLQQLASTINRYFGPFEYHLEQHNVKTSPVMVSLCHLFILGIDEKQAAILLNRDYSSISRYVKKLKMAFGTQESLSVYFRNFILNH